MSDRTWEPTRHLTNAKRLLNEYNKQHGIQMRALPILPIGHWDYLIHRFKPREESQKYSTKKLFMPDLGIFREVHEDPFFASLNEDVESRGGVMSHLCSCRDMTRDPRDLGDIGDTCDESRDLEVPINIPIKKDISDVEIEIDDREIKDRSRVRFSDLIEIIKEVPSPGVLAEPSKMPHG